MKTLREYIDQLDEISRRDFLKGAGATAGLAAVGAPAGVQAQTIGGGEDEAKNAALEAANTFFRYSKNTHKNVAQNVYNVLYQRLMQYYNFSGGSNLAVAADFALKNALKEVAVDFNDMYQQAERDKADSSIGKAYLAKRFGLDDVSRGEQLKSAGSLERFNLEPVANKFVRSYTSSLQTMLEYTKQQNQTPTKKVKEEELEEASDDAIKRIEELTNYK
jgi:hypothetical protein